jgi:hypothetical protein
MLQKLEEEGPPPPLIQTSYRDCRKKVSLSLPSSEYFANLTQRQCSQCKKWCMPWIFCSKQPKVPRKSNGPICWWCSYRYRSSLDEIEVTAKECKTATTGQDINNEEVKKLFGSMSIDPYRTNPRGENVTKLSEGLSIYTHPTTPEGEDVTKLFEGLSINTHSTNLGAVDQEIDTSY